MAEPNPLARPEPNAQPVPQPQQPGVPTAPVQQPTNVAGQLQRPTVVSGDIERQIVSGERQFNELSDFEKRAFADQIIRNQGYLTPGNVYSPEALQSMDQQFRSYLDRSDPGIKLPGWLKPLEWAGSKLYWAYSNFVSRPLSAAILYSSQMDRGNNSWNDAWNAAKYTSPGQAATMMFMTDDELRAEGIDPYDLVKSREAVDKFFSKGWQKWTSGATDFAVAWYADPLVLTFRGVGAARRASYVRPTGAPTQQRIDQIMGSGAMTGLFNLVDNYRATYGIEEGTTRLARQVPSFRNSNNGSGAALADALMRAENADDMSAIMRISLGDHSAMLNTERLSFATAAKLERQVNKQNVIETSYATRVDKTTPEALREKQILDNVAAEITGLERQLGNLSREWALFGTTDRLYFNTLTTPIGASVRGAFQDFNTSFARKGDTKRKLFGKEIPIGSERFRPLTASARLAYNGLYVSPVRLARSFTDDAPVQYIRINDPDSHRAVTALLRDASTLSPELKATFVGRYINASEAERPMILTAIEREAVVGMGSRHGLDYNTAMALYRDFYGRRAAISGTPNYSTATLADGTPVQVVDKAADGSIAAISPVLASQMADSWIMLDFKRMDKLMRQQGPVIQRLLRNDPNLLDKIRHGARITGDTVGGIADTLNKTWKFLQLARIGYGPRAIADEFMGQIAYAGIFPFLARSGRGTVNQFFKGSWANNQMELNRLLQSQLDDAIVQQSKLVDGLSRRMAINNERQASANITGRQRRELRREYDTLRAKYDNEVESLNQIRNQRGELVVRDTMSEAVNVGTRMFRGATDAEGAAFRSSLRADDSFRNLLGSGVGVSGRSMRVPGADGWGTVSAAADEAAHTQAWLRAVNNQIRTDDLARLRASGASEEEMLTFLRTPQGVAYKAQSPFKAMTNEEIVDRVLHHVDRYLPATMNGRDDLARIIAERDLTGAELKAAIPKIRERPDVHNEQLDWALGGSSFGGDIARVAENVITSFYKVMNQLPAERLSRNPLFAQLYRTHLQDLAKGIPEGAYLSPKQYLAYENAARTRALKDVKRLTFNMDYESRIVHTLRFVAPFFGAQMESWARWARIVADKPQVMAHAVNLYNSPMRSGNATTFDGDPVDGHGYATNRLTGEKYKVDKSDIYLNMPVPKGMMKELQKLMSPGKDTEGREISEMRIPINSLNLVLSGDPVFMPGFGPIVQIPANDFVKGGPLSPIVGGAHWESESFFKELGILPYGIKESWWDFINPATGRRLADSEDEYSDKYQRTLMSVMQEEMWKYDEGLRETEPTLKEAMDRARQFTKFEMFANFVLPFSAGFETPLQFYGDMYKKMMEEDPLRGADNFRDKYGDSMWMFTAQLSKNNASLSANSNAIFSQRAMQPAIDESSAEFAGDISHILSGPYATGDFSAGAYYYQLNTPLQTGGFEMMREKIGAAAALERAEAQRGWYLYNKMMLPIQSELYRRGLRTFDEKGAQDLQKMKVAAARVLSSPTLPDGTTPNPYYNENWAREYTSFDTGKYDRFAANLEKVFGHIIPLGLSQGGRSDLNSLYKYLEIRKSVKAELSGRKSQNINAKSNADLKTFMTQNTMALMEQDTRFNELHNRYFNRDMGFDMHGFEED